jgi:NifU-like protein involved in Fe-S cluster formation
LKVSNITIQYLNIEIETIKKSQRETTPELKNVGKRSGVIDVNITNRIQVIEERISCAEDTIENINTTVKKYKKQKSPRHSRKSGHNEKTK